MKAREISRLKPFETIFLDMRKACGDLLFKLFIHYFYTELTIDCGGRQKNMPGRGWFHQALDT